MKVNVPPPNIIDKVVDYFNPITGRKRQAARVAMAVASAAAGSYTGASTSKRSMKVWNVSGGDPDSDILGDLPTLRERSRDLNRNSPMAGGAINTVVTNVIGRGLSLQSRIDRKFLKLSDEAAEAWEENTEREWSIWAESQECDVARTLVFRDMQALAFRQVLENGDVFALLPRFKRGTGAYQLRVQLIEADRVCNPKNATDTDVMAAGIEKDAYGAPIKYHILKQHPGNLAVFVLAKAEWEAVEAFGAKTGMRNVIHLYPVLRPGQTRGVPYLAPVIESLKLIDRYTEAELMAAVVAAMFTVFVQTETGEGFAMQPWQPQTEVQGKGSDEDYKLGNGAIVGLAPNEKVNIANPGRPNSGFDPFVKAILTQIGVALELPYEVLIHCFTASYSASRAALLESWRFFRNRRAWLASNFCQIVYENWLAEAIALGRVPAPGFFKDQAVRFAYSGTMWIGEAPSQIDPVKEVEAAGMRIDLGVSTLDEETVLLTGGDFNKNYPIIVKERKLMKAAGTSKQETVKFPPVPGRPQDQEEEEEDTDAETA
jgi:lambda family phage portal protein